VVHEKDGLEIEGFVKVPHSMLKALAKLDLTGCERRVLDCILGETLGWQRETKEDLSCSQIAEVTGLQRQNAHRALRGLEAAGVIKTVTTGYRMTITLTKNSQLWTAKNKHVIKGDDMLPLKSGKDVIKDDDIMSSRMMTSCHQGRLHVPGRNYIKKEKINKKQTGEASPGLFDAVKPEYREELREVLKRFPKKGKFNPYGFVAKKLKDGGFHHGALVKVLKDLVEALPQIEKPWAWASAMLEDWSGEYNYQDFLVEHEKRKEEERMFAKSEEGQRLLAMLNLKRIPAC